MKNRTAKELFLQDPYFIFKSAQRKQVQTTMKSEVLTIILSDISDWFYASAFRGKQDCRYHLKLILEWQP